MTPNFVAKELAGIQRRLADLERRLENSFRQGAVEDVDPEKQLMRMKIGKSTDGEDQLSPWIPYAQVAGGLKIHTPPTKGQNFMMIAPGGEMAQAFGIPVTWNDANKSPSSKGDENVITYGDATISLKGDALSVKVPRFFVECGGTTFELTGGGLKASAPDYDWS